MSSASSTPGTLERAGLVPYLFYDDVAAMLDWYARAFGWVEHRRWVEDGELRNAEVLVGDTELWLDSGGRDHLAPGGEAHAPWIGVWSDPDEMYARVRALDIECAPPEDKPYGVRMLTVSDPAGYQWGFMVRTQ